MLGVALYTLWFLLSLASIIHLLLNKREPSSTIAWLFFVTVFPILGAVLFLVFGPQRLERQASKRRKEIERLVRAPRTAALPLADGGSESPATPKRDSSGSRQPTDASPFENPAGLAPGESAVLRLARQVSDYGVTTENSVEMLPDPDHALLAMQAAIDRAERFIHLEYYIIAYDEVTDLLFRSLLRAAERGVEVRILYDAIGSLSLKRIYFRKLAQAGVKIAGFLPFSAIPQRINVNFRNHRKILIVDGRVGFTGGTNIGRQYLGRRNKGQWHDYSVRVEGPVCLQLQDVFAKDWHFTTQEDLFLAAYYPHQAKAAGESVIQVLESGPDSPFATLHQALFLAINTAQQEVLLTTPYFVPDPSIMAALTVAALRGVRVRLLFPLKSDLPLVRFASRSFYDALLRAGVEIYEYRPRILHAKLMVIDQKWTMLGSANMDIRSFRLNFELNLLIYGTSVASQATQLFLADLEQSQRVDPEVFERRPLTQQMLENACRLLSPVL